MDVKKLQEKATLEWTEEALGLVENLPDDFPVEECEKWAKENIFVMGSTFVLRFLNEKRKKRFAEEKAAKQAAHEEARLEALKKARLAKEKEQGKGKGKEVKDESNEEEAE